MAENMNGPPVLGDDELRQPLSLIDLPDEVNLIICSMCSYRDLEALRRTSKAFSRLLSNDEIENMLGKDLELQMLQTCSNCLTEGPPLNFAQLRAAGAAYPISYCFHCYGKEIGFNIGQRVYLGDDWSARVCCWCGYPITTSSTAMHLVSCQGEHMKAQKYHYGLSCFEATAALFNIATCLGEHAVSGCGPYRVISMYDLSCPSQKANLLALVLAGLILKGTSASFMALDPRPHKAFHYAGFLDLVRSLCYFSMTYQVLWHAYLHGEIIGGPLMLLFSVTNLGFASASVARNVLLTCEYPFWTFARKDFSPGERSFHKGLTWLCLRGNQWCQTQEYPPLYGWRQTFGIRDSVMNGWDALMVKLETFYLSMC